MKNKLVFIILLITTGQIFAQQKKQIPHGKYQLPISKVWMADQGNGTYKNPVINADYSDPDAIRVRDDFYLVSLPALKQFRVCLYCIQKISLTGV
jgi:hypothetical protein